MVSVQGLNIIIIIIVVVIDYLFTNVKERPVSLVCGASVAVRKEYNIRRHYEMKHQDKYEDLDIEDKLQKVEEMKKSLVLQQTMFTKAKSQSEAAVKDSFIVVAESTALMRESLSKSAWSKFVTSCAQIKGKYF